MCINFTIVKFRREINEKVKNDWYLKAHFNREHQDTKRKKNQWKFKMLWIGQISVAGTESDNFF